MESNRQQLSEYCTCGWSFNKDWKGGEVQYQQMMFRIFEAYQKFFQPHFNIKSGELSYIPRNMDDIQKFYKYVLNFFPSCIQRLCVNEPQFLVISKFESRYANENQDYVLCEVQFKKQKQEIRQLEQTMKELKEQNFILKQKDLKKKNEFEKQYDDKYLDLFQAEETIKTLKKQQQQIFDEVKRVFSIIQNTNLQQNEDEITQIDTTTLNLMTSTSPTVSIPSQELENLVHLIENMTLLDQDSTGQEILDDRQINRVNLSSLEEQKQDGSVPFSRRINQIIQNGLRDTSANQNLDNLGVSQTNQQQNQLSNRQQQNQPSLANTQNALLNSSFGRSQTATVQPRSHILPQAQLNNSLNQQRTNLGSQNRSNAQESNPFSGILRQPQNRDLSGRNFRMPGRTDNGQQTNIIPFLPSTQSSLGVNDIYRTDQQTVDQTQLVNSSSEQLSANQAPDSIQGGSGAVLAQAMVEQSSQSQQISTSSIQGQQIQDLSVASAVNQSQRNSSGSQTFPRNISINRIDENRVSKKRKLNDVSNQLGDNYEHYPDEDSEDSDNNNK
eukprot:403373056